MDGSRVYADQLRLDGGDVLVAPGANHTTTLRVEKIPIRDQDVVCLTIETPMGRFSIKVTAEHFVLARGPSDELLPYQARELVTYPRDVFASNSFRSLVGAVLQREETRVVKVIFKDPQQYVLAWLLPEGRRRPKCLFDEAAFCCLGSPHSPLDFDKLHPELRVKGTFLDEAIENSDLARRRALSEGATSRSQGAWSVGVEENNPFCPFQVPGKHSCRRGAGCRMSHAPHRNE